jgi:RHS repeat-associated protein
MPNDKYGLAKSLSVMPGDTVEMEVYAKYLDNNTNNWTEALTTLMTQIAQGTAPSGTFIDGGAPGSIDGTTFPFIGVLPRTGETGTGPKAYLNYMIFDKNFVFKTGGFKRLSELPKENGTDVPHEKLAFEGAERIIVKEPGYVYIYLSNENDTPVEVYFDDFKVKHSKGPIVSSQDYYPFGLTFNSYQKENSLKQRFRFQGQEHIDDLDLGWDSFKWRNHQPDIGRFFNIDPLTDKYVYNSPYAFSENKVVAHVELEGLEAVGIEAVDVVNAMIPVSQPSGGDKVLTGMGNVVFGTVGAIGASAYIIGTEGAGVALGGGVAVALSLGEVAIGLTQIVDGISEMNGGPSDKSGTLEASNSLPGLVSKATGSEHAQMVVALGQFVPGMLSGGNVKALKEGWSVIRSSQNTAEATQNVLSTVDAALDTKGLIDAALQYIQPEQSSTTGSPGLKIDANKPDDVPNPNKQQGLY